MELLKGVEVLKGMEVPKGNGSAERYRNRRGADINKSWPSRCLRKRQPEQVALAVFLHFGDSGWIPRPVTDS
ncbi:hypothetical protein [Fontibacillus phaseoli]|uniref:hypothetical protein n=1 Tax=Fontibacillus phaseoli TaxID=1416533 RepID=UPI000DF40E97|nr:hypothetical protein [Fontibacillus phaseoli]